MKLFRVLYQVLSILLLPFEWWVATRLALVFIYVIPSTILFGKITPLGVFDTPGALPLYAVSMLVGTFFAVPLWLRRKVKNYFLS